MKRWSVLPTIFFVQCSAHISRLSSPAGAWPCVFPHHPTRARGRTRGRTRPRTHTHIHTYAYTRPRTYIYVSARPPRARGRAAVLVVAPVVSGSGCFRIHEEPPQLLPRATRSHRKPAPRSGGILIPQRRFGAPADLLAGAVNDLSFLNLF